MHSLTIRILFFLLTTLPAGLSAGPRPAPSHAADADAQTEHVHATHRHTVREAVKDVAALCDDMALNNPEASLRALIGRNFAEHYYVGLSAGKSWRPLEHYGDYDNKVRVYNPKLGVAVRYNF